MKEPQTSNEQMKEESKGSNASTQDGYKARMSRQDLNEFRCVELFSLALRGSAVKEVKYGY